MVKKVEKLNLNELGNRLIGLLSLPPCQNKDYQVYPLSKEMEERVFQGQKGLCYLCLVATTTPRIHHIKPDGKSTTDNLVMLCSDCHFWIHKMLGRHLGYKRVVRLQGGETQW